MRLSKIKLAGFKSFVDPTAISFPSNLVGVVGPNGCGKSNVIDAVRWVMGESSASRLRGDSMTDVIFNGSRARKPVGTASIELLFDNSDGTVGGQYASFSEVSIRRSVSRDALSTYYLNGVKCRRKDITGIFLGTGLGPRSYSIIEQGMISRLIEAKPEELRVYIEEAAGISKYKERRRETENRIRHTRDNLERLNDLLEEVENHIKHLDRQARTAERYKALKADERRTSAQLLALRLRELDTRAETHERRLADCETRLQAAIAEQRRAEAEIEKTRDQHTVSTDAFNDVQGRFYKVGAEIARLEQAIEHGRELKERQLVDLEQARAGAQEIVEHIEQDETTLEQLQLALDELTPGVEEARRREQASGESLRLAEAAMADWREQWEAFSRAANESEQTLQVERARIEQYEQLGERHERQRLRIEQERAQVSLDAMRGELAEIGGEEAARAALVAEADEQVATVKAQITRAREREQQLARELQNHQALLQTTIGRYSAARALQEASQGDGGADTAAWLDRTGLGDLPRLAQSVQVEPGWERAVETVLGERLQAISVDSLDNVARELRGLESGAIMFMQATPSSADAGSHTLAAKVSGAPVSLRRRLERVRAVASLSVALGMRQQLDDGESLITKDGEWISRDFLAVNRTADEQGGALRRERQLRGLKSDLKKHRGAVEGAEGALKDVREELTRLEHENDQAQMKAGESHREHADLLARLDNAKYRVKQTEERWAGFQRDTRDLEADSAATRTNIVDSQKRLQQAQATIETLTERRATLEEQREKLAAELQRVSSQSEEDRVAAHDLALRFESRRSSQESATQSLARMHSQLNQFRERETALSEQITAAEQPLEEKRSTLEAELERRVEVEQELGSARQQLEGLDSTLRSLEQQHSDAQTKVAAERDTADAARMAAQETRVRREGLLEQFEATGFELDASLAELEPDATIDAWTDKFAKLTRRIERLGPINLAAIDEFREQSERKDYLDAQLTDLTDALETLENAIRKIDRETRSRFRDTYDKIDAGFKLLFPKLFGGGHAYLELTGDDLLSTGVTVMARPPGKRNSTIHLLSGGEKALAAVALVFAIFELNPAPFCMLDEVDAPLDDANVGRYCEIVKSMSERVQFVFITHNKVTMEMARQLIGVTMQEPGVSRLVTVDLDEAVKMAVS